MNEILKKRIEEAAYSACRDSADISLREQNIFSIKLGAEYALSNQWISVDEALPEYDEAVIVAFGDDDYALLHRSNNPNVLTDKNGFCNYGYKEVLAWLPIPKFETKKK